MVTVLVELVDHHGQAYAGGTPDPDGYVQWYGDDSRPPLGGYPRIRITHPQEDTDAPHP